MITMTAVQFAENPSHAQKLAENEPVLVANGDKKQVLLDFEQYQTLAGTDTGKNFVSAYDAFFGNMSPELRQALASMSDEELED